VTEVGGIEECYVRLLSQIGKPIDHPLVASVQILPKSGIHVDRIAGDIRAIVDTELANITCITERVIRGELTTF